MKKLSIAAIPAMMVFIFVIGLINMEGRREFLLIIFDVVLDSWLLAPPGITLVALLLIGAAGQLIAILFQRKKPLD